MLDNAFQRRREIERMLLAGRKLTIPAMMERFGVGRDTIRRDFDIISGELPLVVKQGYGGGYSLMDGCRQHQNILSQEQLKCLEELKQVCSEKQKAVLQSMIHEFGPYAVHG